MPIDMETRLATPKEKLKMVLDAMTNMRKENEELKQCNLEFSNAGIPSHNEQGEGGA